MDGQLTGTLTTSGQLSCSLSSSPLSGELTVSGSVPSYTGEYEVTPSASEAQTLATQGLMMSENVVVLKIPYWETSNEKDGLTVFIADEAS